jgi:hypothetical protein
VKSKVRRIMRRVQSWAAQLKRESELLELQQIGSRSRLDRSFHRLWITTRLCCASCDGYLIVRGRLDRAFRFAGCSNYTDEGCRFTLTSKEYVRRKAAAIDAMLTGDDPPFQTLQFRIPAKYATKRGSAKKCIP